ncbi:ubiquitin carboxyl-terminal hydrolase 25 [Protopterus annectens]|uniref:ubiquitin carboxyl-terminal hydrolase 25 n=1 Tax=Protopterus annectens TaxID=7888 RepID=UPI001CFBD997|nr:ubiquitin carboxyl-terminal hydrolase 25 [Protopterus annectens]
MTVEQNVLQQSSQKHQQTFLNQLREITGINDIQVLQKALKDSNGNLELAVACLTAKSAKTQQQQQQEAESSYYQTSQTGNDRYISVGSQADTNVIDLTGDDKDDLQRAIALSLEESNRTYRETGITDEDEAISRVLEASIAENKASLKRTHTEVWSDSPNPYDRKRQENCPVGLKNVGNTCWFSAVIQSLFNLLEFRRLVLNYATPACAQNVPHNHKEKRNLPFMRELRYLFALLVGSKRKYVDPSRAVDILKDAFKSSDSQQQDVSEFTHKLLDWLEDAFQIKAEDGRGNEEDKVKNPMVELFYGKFLAIGVHEGKRFENTELFGQYPLQVNGFKHLHECLEAAMVEGEIESLHSENCVKSGQEHWFTELPPVLTFELSRFEFNQALGRPEKIHNKLEFPHVLYMDRYMVKNRDATRRKRDEIRRLKEQLMVLQQRLERYLSYGSGPKRFPLADVLQYALEFASSKPVCVSPVDDIETSVPPSGTVASQPTPSTTEQTSRAFLTSISVSLFLPYITDLQESISRIHCTIDMMYADKLLMQNPYKLHAVLVHEGQANAGHYWAYIFDHNREWWMKYNDISVTKSSWEELERDSFGGYRNASAYCLMYISVKETYLIQEELDKETGQPLIGWHTLPPDLQEYVKEDNRRFEKELEEWDAQQTRKAEQEPISAAQTIKEYPPSATQAQAVEPEYMEQASQAEALHPVREETVQAINQAAAGCEEQGPEETLHTTSEEESPVQTAPAQRIVEVEIPHVGTFVIESEEGGYDDEVMLSPTMQGIIMAIGRAQNVYDRFGPEAGFFKAIKTEYARLVRMAQEDTPPENDYRLQHVLVYFIQNEAPRKIIERTLLEQFADRNLGFDERCRNVMKVARSKLDMLKPDEVNIEEYERWHQDYRDFLETTVYLTFSLESFQKGSYEKSLICLIYAYQYNRELLSKGMYRGHDEDLISHYRRDCLLKLNECAAGLFESGDDQDVNEGLRVMNEYVVPCLPLLLVDETEEKDIAAVEDMRNRWCSYLGEEMEPNLQEKLTDFLPKLLDCSMEIKGLCEPPKLPSLSTHELCERYANVMISLSRMPADGR